MSLYGNRVDEIIGIEMICAREVTILPGEPQLMDLADDRHAWASKNSIHIYTLVVGWLGRGQRISYVASGYTIHYARVLV
jgi:hypothetical protein